MLASLILVKSWLGLRMLKLITIKRLSRTWKVINRVKHSRLIDGINYNCKKFNSKVIETSQTKPDHSNPPNFVFTFSCIVIEPFGIWVIIYVIKSNA